MISKYELRDAKTNELVMVGTCGEVARFVDVGSSCVTDAGKHNYKLKGLYRATRVADKEDKTKLNDDLIIKYLYEGKTFEEIAELMNIPEERVKAFKKYCGDHGYTYRNRDRKRLKVCNTPREYFSEDYKTCPVCGRVFACRNEREWGYKIGGKRRRAVCTWSCLRTYERKNG